MKTYKDFYDYLNAYGVEAYDQMATKMADDMNRAKEQYLVDQKKKQEKTALQTARIGTLTDLLNEWFPPEAFRMVSPEKMAESFYKTIEDYSKMEDTLKAYATHVKDVKVETQEVPGGTKTTITGKLDSADAKAAFDDLRGELDKIFKWK